MYSLRTFGMSVKGLDNLSGQLTLLCFLAGGGAAFLSYWFRSDNYYIVLYGTTGILAGMFTMLVDYGVNLESRRTSSFLSCLHGSYLENVMWPRMNREGTAEHVPAVTAEEDRREPANLRSIGRDRRSNSNNRRGLEQTAASREKQEERSKDNWLHGIE